MITLSIAVAMLSMASVLRVQDQQQQDQPEKSVSDLLGAIQREQLQEGPYNIWFDKQYDGYQSDQDQLQELRQRLTGVTVKLFLGTWCKDSKRQVPRFFSLLDEVGYSSEHVELIAINRSKEVPSQFGSGLNIHHVPTFIIMRGDRELGRIIETPVVSLERDMLTILRGEPYTPNHSKLEKTVGVDH